MELVAENDALSFSKGYKQTEVGLIPSDWKVKTIGEIFTFYSTANFSKAEMTLYGEVGCVHYGLIHAIENSHYSLSSGIKYYVTKEQAKYETIQEGDVIMVDASEDLVGLNKSVEVFNVNNKEYIAGLHTFHLRDINSDYVGIFRGLILNSSLVKKQMLRLAVGMKVFGVSKPQLQQVFVPVPTKAEQTAIATALSDADALISSLEKLIAKKRNIKQGAMQKLLQPKEGWEVKKLGEVCEVFSGGTPDTSNSNYYGGNINWITSGDLNKQIINEVEGKITDDGLQNSSAKLIKPNTVLLAMYGATAGVSAISKIEGAINQAILAMLPFSNYNYEFLFYCLAYYKDWIIITYTQGGQPNLSGSIIKSIEMYFPSFEEQTRIATILSDMDAEISALETKLEKYRKVKLGMMQNLLTGKIRLV
jgi:type I restriction enzyme S subunit